MLNCYMQGILRGNASLISEKEQFIRLWSHECLRIFHDRLVDDSDRTWFNHMLVEKVIRLWLGHPLSMSPLRHGSLRG